MLVGVPPEQTYPAVIVQVAEHPFEFVASLSSHSSKPALKPSLHTVTHVSFVPLGSYPSGHSEHVSGPVVSPPEQT